MTDQEPIRPASDAEVAEWTPTERNIRTSFTSWRMACLVARIEADAATIRELREKIKLHEAAADIADAIIEDNDLTHSIKRLMAENATQAEEIRSAYGVIESLCSCGGMGPADPGACDACRIYHAMKAKR